MLNKYSEYYRHALGSAVFTFIIIFVINLLSPIRDFNYFRSYMPDTEKVKAEIAETFGLDALFIVFTGVFLYIFLLIVLTLTSKKLLTWNDKIKGIVFNLLLGLFIYPITLYVYLFLVVFSMVFILIDLYSIPFLFFMK